MWARRLLAVTVTSFALIASACSSGGQDKLSPSAGPTTLGAEVASADLYVGAPMHFQIGVVNIDSSGTKVLAFGKVQLQFSYLGSQNSQSESPGPKVTATYLPTYGTPATGKGPALYPPSQARGVYLADGLTFDKAGAWRVDVSYSEGGAAQTTRSLFLVTEKPALPATGQRAIPSRNLTMADKGDPQAIDSRAIDGNPVPDPELHKFTIAEAVRDHVPALVIFSTPAYCVSQFCGPETDEVAALSKRYGDRAKFIHVEIWHDHQAQPMEVNKAAADWVYRNGDLTEPWTFLIGADGRIVDRWGPLLDEQAISAELAKLPKIS